MIAETNHITNIPWNRNTFYHLMPVLPAQGLSSSIARGRYAL
ncbi:hypothetical protein KL86DYS2_11150 [uncultured Dysgonomonas sp.]|uniref:Uncharacterized protein n=1 Tax=uncultured Dysgonomonas sp. TaxID=206096 RepID=A0A212JBD7_9BACT|nr:hypothetical protein KL86DYS2_11150 [uncultured Dysgonomonas sp.]